MKIKAYDKYHKQWLYVIIGENNDDEIWDEVSSGPNGVLMRHHILFQAIDGDSDNCDPKRWSDLEKIKLIK